MEGVIYKIYQNDNIYIGSTVNYNKRISRHRSSCNTNSKLRVHQFINENGGFDTFCCEIIEENIPFQMLPAKERFYYERLNANLNTNYPNRNRKEGNQAYRELHREELNKKKVAVKDCECGCKYTVGNFARHCKTKKHNKLLKIKKEVL